MKKIIVGLVVLLGVFVLWEDMSKQDRPSPYLEEKIQVSEEIVFKSDEFIDEPQKEIVVEKVLLVDIGKDINITRENNVTLTVLLDDNGSYDYIWKEDENIIGLGKVLTKAYGKGEHLVKLEVLDAGELVGEDEVKITAWDYLKIEKMYRVEENEFNIFEKKIYDHHNWLLLLEHPVYAKTMYLYNEGGKVLEERYEAFEDDNRSYTLLYTYDDDNHILSMERLDIDENIIESLLYDENGEVIVLSSEEKKELSSSEDYFVDNSVKTYNKQNQLIKREVDSDGYKFLETMKYKEGKLVLKERFTESGHYVFKYQYNENGKVTLRKSTKTDNESRTVWMNSVKTEYSKDGEMLKQERKNIYKDEVQTHVVQHWSYKNKKIVEHKIEALEGVCPCTSDIVKEKTVYIYDRDGKLLKKQYQSQKENEEELQKEKTSMKIVRIYTNIL